MIIDDETEAGREMTRIGTETVTLEEHVEVATVMKDEGGQVAHAARLAEGKENDEGYLVCPVCYWYQDLYPTIVIHCILDHHGRDRDRRRRDDGRERENDDRRDPARRGDERNDSRRGDRPRDRLREPDARERLQVHATKDSPLLPGPLSVLPITVLTLIFLLRLSCHRPFIKFTTESRS